MSTTPSAQATLQSLQSNQNIIEGSIHQLNGWPSSMTLEMVVGAYSFDLAGTSQAMHSAVQTPVVSGSPSQIQSIATQYQGASTQASDAATQVQIAGAQKLPVAWTGPAWESASVVFQAVWTELQNVSEGLSESASAITAYGTSLGSAITTDKDGHAMLASAVSTYVGFVGNSSNTTVAQVTAVLNQAANGLSKRVSAWQGLSSASTKFIELLDEYGAQARAGQMAGSSEDALTAEVIATAQDPDAPDSGAGVDIDSANSLALGSQRLTAMDAADQAKFQSLLNASGSPQEAAYLWKAVAAGYPMSTVVAFDQAIGSHGNDPDWLAQHLDINLGASEDPGVGSNVDYPGDNGSAPFSQGSVNDCVAASTVMAAVQNDPVLSLFLTTGFSGSQFNFLLQSKSQWVGGRFGHMQTTTFPYAAGDDSLAAVQARTQALFQYEYSQGLSHDGIDTLDEIWPGAGIGEWGQHYLANSLLGNMNNANYQFVKMNNATDRANALQQIDASVDAGVPVTFTVRAQGITNTFNRHQMVIIGSDASTGMLEVYNPWGYTQWISSQDFINGNLGALTNNSDGNMGLPYNIEIPTSDSP